MTITFAEIATIRRNANSNTAPSVVPKMNFETVLPIVKRELNKMTDDEYKEVKAATLEVLTDQDEKRGIKPDDDNNI